jgi:NADPH:quinone reductase-like Zn-dependent oxidoreductase
VGQETEDLLPDDEIQIEAKAIGMNSQDIMAATGKLDTCEFGLECSGIITKVENKIANFSVGNRIAAISVTQGTFTTYLRINAAFTFRK